MILRTLFLLGALLQSTLAYVEFTGPQAGDSISGTSLTITWQDNKKTPLIADLASYQLFLCAGGNSDSSYVWTILGSGQIAS